MKSDADEPRRRSHRSPWRADVGASASRRIAKEPVTVDACVVGGGMAGLLCALELTERGKSVVVLERDGVGAGDTAATTAHLTAVLDYRYFELADMHGQQAIRHVASSHLRGIAHLERVANAYGIECGFERVSGFLCAEDTQQAKALIKELEAATAAGLSCELVRRAPLPVTDGIALHVRAQAQFDPLTFLAGVARVLAAKGVPIYAPAAVSNIDSGTPDSVVLETSDGTSIRASHAVIATNTPISDATTIHIKQAAYRTYAIAVAVAKREPVLAWDMEDPYHYARIAIDAVTKQSVLVVGGEDHRVGQDAASNEHFPRLESWVRERFPAAGEVVCQWSGEVFEPSDGLGFIGKSPGQERVFIATGFSGNGMTYSALAAGLVADLIQGIENPLSQLYDPSRKPKSARAIGQFLTENLNTARQYADWVSPADVTNAKDIPRGQGAVLRRGLRRVAVYVDADGSAHELSATCPHLGGVVSWNPIENSWDCPCHGSRFACDGKVITGPAVRDLQPLSSPSNKSE
jgi:glycine/D-amino acid oxidase-like deaminating enzyme/nitrite reductase/ring-hydroxylating ferredoxin subunit